MKKKIGFIGCGNMGEAILSGVIKAKVIHTEQIWVSCFSEESRQRIKDTYGVHVASNKEVARQSDILILAVKPHTFESVIAEIKEIAKNKLIVSVAAGITLSYLEERFSYSPLKVVRVMPNTPACVQEAMSSISVNSYVEQAEKEEIKSIFSSFGKIVEIDEEMIHAVIAVSGSSPAYVFMLLDAMIQNGVKHGLQKKEARLLASQAVLGAAKMVQESTEAVDQLKCDVCSPNGTTIEAVHTLEAGHFYEVIDQAMDACYVKSKKMSE